MSENTVPEIDRTIYPMPMFATFEVTDIRAAETLYQAVGFVSLATIPGPGGVPALVHLRRMKHQDLLLVPGRPQQGSTTVSFTAGGQDLGRLAAELRAGTPGGVRVEGPADTAWFTTDVTIEDPDGNRVVLTAPREAEMDRARDWARGSIEGDFVVDEHSGPTVPRRTG